VTASGLIFVGASADETFRAFGKDTLQVLWKAKLAFSGSATPGVDSVRRRQHLAFSAGGCKIRPRGPA
jgi:quinoprotein glucose dehydrogenase